MGMAMTFTLVSHLREELSRLVRARAELKLKEDMEKERNAKRKEMRQLVRRLEAVIGGMSLSINQQHINGHSEKG